MWSDPRTGRNHACLGDIEGKMANVSEQVDLDDLIAACRHLEDLEVFVGQRSRVHPGPGWTAVLHILARNLDEVRSELLLRNIPWPTACRHQPPGC